MIEFGFILHPLDKEQIKKFFPRLSWLPISCLLPLLKYFLPFKAPQDLKTSFSIKGKKVCGYFIICPFLPEQILGMDEKFLLKRIVLAAKLACKLGARIIGLGGYLALLGEREISSTQSLKGLAITNGSSYTAWSIFEAIYRSVKSKQMDFKKSTLTLLGAGGPLGSLCARKFSYYIPRLIIVNGQSKELTKLKERVLQLNPIEIITEDDPHRAVKNADIVIITSEAKALPDISEFKSGAIVCDATINKSLVSKSKSLRKDITLIDGGLIKLPSQDIIDAGLAETILLALERKFYHYSFGDNINIDRLEEIANIAAGYGFEVMVEGAPLV